MQLKRVNEVGVFGDRSLVLGRIKESHPALLTEVPSPRYEGEGERNPALRDKLRGDSALAEACPDR